MLKWVFFATFLKMQFTKCYSLIGKITLYATNWLSVNLTKYENYYYYDFELVAQCAKKENQIKLRLKKYAVALSFFQKVKYNKPR